MCVCVCVWLLLLLLLLLLLFVCLFVCRGRIFCWMLLFWGGWGRKATENIVIVYSKATVTRVANRNKFCVEKDGPVASSFSGCVTNSLSRAKTVSKL